MESQELDAFRQECRAVDKTLAVVPPDAWAYPALGSWSVAELVAHLARGVSRITDYVDRPVPEDAVFVDRVTYWDQGGVDPADIAARAVQAAREVDAETLPALFTEGWGADSELAATLPADRGIVSVRGPIRLDEYVATRVLEVTIHHLDLRIALDQPPSPTAAAGEETMKLLERRLGGPRPRNLGRVRFLQVATGRILSDDPRFPLLA
jgi:uncharacterized protein (TIGR03083 family)